jgi:hypothetical protein
MNGIETLKQSLLPYWAGRPFSALAVAPQTLAERKPTLRLRKLLPYGRRIREGHCESIMIDNDVVVVVKRLLHLSWAARSLRCTGAFDTAAAGSPLWQR